MTIRGAPLLEATIDVDGTVRDVRMIKSVHPCLDNSIVEALKQWRFEPGTRNGKPVPVLYSMTVHIHVR